MVIIIKISNYICIKAKSIVKFSLDLTKHHTMKMYWGSGVLAP
jgi:hypothetical protein